MRPELIFSDDEIGVLRRGLRIMALQRLGDPDSADDAVQESLSRALHALGAGQLRDPSRLGAFVRGIARHVIADMAQDRRRTVTLDSGSKSYSASNSDPLERLVSSDERARVRRALRKLRASDRRVLELSFFEHLRPREIAKMTGETSDRVRKRKSRALQRLREAFQADGPRVVR